MIEQFEKQYRVSKTISIGLIPVGKTADNVKDLIRSDAERDKRAVVVKEYIDRYHRTFISEILSDRGLIPHELLHSYMNAFLNKDKDAQADLIDKMATLLAETFLSREVTIKNKKVKVVDIITKLPDKMLFEIMMKSDLYTAAEKDDIELFKGYTGFFGDLFKVRRVLYDFKSENGVCKHGSIASRLLNENLNRFMQNLAAFELASDKVEIADKTGYFTTDGFNLVLSQSGIDVYNTILGGYNLADGTKVQGFNEKINLYNQHISGTSDETPLPLLKPLYKMPLVKSDSFSFIPVGFTSEKDVVTALAELSSVYDTEYIGSYATDILNGAFDWSDVYIKFDAFPVVSKIISDDWRSIESAWNRNYDSTKSSKLRSKETYADNRRKAFVKNGSLSVSDICALLNIDVETFLSEMNLYFTSEIKAHILSSVPHALIKNVECKEKSNFTDDEKVSIKNYLDNIKTFEKFVKIFDPEISDILFTGELDKFVGGFAGFDPIYNKIRNYCTKKPYDAKKMKLSFDNSQFLAGWAVGNESARRGFILRDKNSLYLASALTSEAVTVLQSETDDEEYYEKMFYNQIPDSAKMLPKVFFSKNYCDTHDVPSDVLALIKKKRSGGKYTADDEQQLIRYYQECISTCDDWNDYEFVFKDHYDSLLEFLRDVDKQSYYLRFINISKASVDKLVEDGEILLFRLYNKDFSEFAHGRPDNYTRYLMLLFDENNSRGEYVQLKGGAEMFFRPASMPKRVTHRKNQPLYNKVVRNGKKSSTFPYDLIMHKRYTEDRFILHLCIGINSECNDNFPYALNMKVRDIIKESGRTNVIGVNRGENNLVYVTVIDKNGKILESRSLNVIDGCDYNALLTDRMNKRAEQRESWGAIDGIKNLKNGYCSKVVNEICKLIVKYDAIVVFDNVTTGFVSKRGKIEKNVYQQIQGAVINKLNYLTFKDVPDEALGSYKRGLQLSNAYKDPKDISTQSGIVFFLSSWGISTTDVKTGFINVLPTKYVNKDRYIEFLSKFDGIFFDDDKEMFCFGVDYKNFLTWEELPDKTEWKIYTNGLRSDFYRDKRTGKIKHQRIDVTAGFKDLLNEYGIDWRDGNLKDAILAVDRPDFFKRFAKLFELTVTMRNMEDDEQYIISPVADKNGNFFDSREITDKSAPECCDANAAYNIARKGLMLMDNLSSDDDKSPFRISKVDWMNYATNV